MELFDAFKLPASPAVYGPLAAGVYIQISLGTGFYVPQDAFDRCKAEANRTHRIQFLSITSAGEPVTGTRDECLERGCGLVAWIHPD